MPTATPEKKHLYKPQAFQLEFHESTARFRVIVGGRRVGKTYCVAQEVFKFCAENKNVEVWWVGSTQEVADRGLTTILACYPESSVQYNRYVRKTTAAFPRKMFFKNGTLLVFKTAEGQKGLRGAGLALVVLDECADIKDPAWNKDLRPTLSDTGGKAILLGTPDRRNFFWEMWNKGIKGEANYASFNWPSNLNEMMYDVKAEMVQAREDLAEEDFRNQYLAEWLEDDSQVFKGCGQCIRKQDKVNSGPNRWWVEDKNDGKHVYAFGVDVAKSGKDFTVIIATKYIRNKTKWEKRVVYLERINEDSLLIQAQRIHELWVQFGKPLIHIDATSIGGALVDELGRFPQQIPTHSMKPIIFDGKNKGEIIGRLRADIEHNRCAFPNIPVLIEELEQYERIHNSNTGNTKYGAPGRKHDDCVVALALATMRECVSSKRVFGRNTRVALGF